MPWGVAGALASTAISAGIGAATAPDAPQTSWQAQALALQNISTAQSAANSTITDNDISGQQLNWARQQYAQQAPITQNYMAQLSGLSAGQQAQYQNTYQPLMNTYAQQAQAYDTPAAEDAASGRAVSDVAQANTAARSSALSSLQSFGIDPSQTRFAALDAGTRTAGAAAEAAAGTNARLQTQQTGLGLEANAIGQGSNLGQQASSEMSASNQMGLQTAQTYGNLEGTGVNWGQMGNSATSNAIGAANGGVGAANTSFNQAQTQYADSLGQSQSLAKGIGGLVGSQSTGGGLLSGSNLQSAYNGLFGSGAGIPSDGWDGNANSGNAAGWS